jgi:hypothetical protein
MGVGAEVGEAVGTTAEAVGEAGTVRADDGLVDGVTDGVWLAQAATRTAATPIAAERRDRLR